MACEQPGLRRHWDEAYAHGDLDKSWYQEHAPTSMQLINELNVAPEAPIIDVGGGASTLVGDLIDGLYVDITVLDISEAALRIARGRLGSEARHVNWLAEDLLTWQPQRVYRVWHDRAVLHFLTDESQRRIYREKLLAATEPGSAAVIGVFGPNAPEQCSGLDVIRFDVNSIGSFLAPDFEVVHSRSEQHTTPNQTSQDFLWTVGMRRANPDPG